MRNEEDILPREEQGLKITSDFFPKTMQGREQYSEKGKC